MALFLRGSVWWYEYRTTKLRVVKSTGFRKDDRAKAEAAFAAFKLGIGVKPRRSAMEAMLDAIYSTARTQDGFPLASVWAVYEDWMKGKARVVKRKTLVVRRTSVRLFVEFCLKRGITDMGDASVPVARQFVATLADKSNKTVRNRINDLSTVWEACSQIRPGVFNPWKAACPDDDGSSQRRDVFSAVERERVFAACRETGHDWYGVSLVACYTGLRYGDIATLDWSSLDMDAKTLRLTQRKTDKPVVVPLARDVYGFLALMPRREGFVFPEHACAYTSNRKMRPAYAEVLKLAEVDGYHDFHSWRHTFRSMLAEAGVSDDTAMRLGGWTNLAMSRHYDHDPHLREMREAVDAITSSPSTTR